MQSRTLTAFLLGFLLFFSPLALRAAPASAPVTETTVAIVAGKLVITDVAGKADVLTVTHAAGMLTITDPGREISAPGYPGDGTDTVTIPVADVTGGTVLFALGTGPLNTLTVAGAMPLDVDVAGGDLFTTPGMVLFSGNSVEATAGILTVAGPFDVGTGDITLRGGTLNLWASLGLTGTLTFLQPGDDTTAMTLKGTPGFGLPSPPSAIILGDNADGGDVTLEGSVFLGGAVLSGIPITAQTRGTLRIYATLSNAGSGVGGIPAPMTLRGNVVDVIGAIVSLGVLSILQPGDDATAMTLKGGGGFLGGPPSAFILGDNADGGDVTLDPTIGFFVPGVPITAQTRGTLTLLGPLDNSGGGGGPAAPITLRGNVVDAQSLIGTIGVFSVLQPGDDATAMTFKDGSGGGGFFLGGPPSAFVLGDNADGGNVTLDPTIGLFGPGIPITAQTRGTLTLLGPLDNSGGGGGPAAPITLRGNVVDAQSLIGTIGVFSVLQPGDDATAMTFKDGSGGGGFFLGGPPSAFVLGDNADGGNVTLDPTIGLFGPGIPITAQTRGTLTLLGPLDNSGGGGGPAAPITLRGNVVDAQSLIGTIGVFSVLQPGDDATAMTFKDGSGGGGFFLGGPPSAFVLGDNADGGNVTLDPTIGLFGPGIPITAQTRGTLTLLGPLDNSGGGGGPAAPITLRGNVVDAQSLIGTIGVFSVLQPGDDATAMTFKDGSGGGGFFLGGPPSAFVLGDNADGGNVTLDPTIGLFGPGIPITAQTRGTLTLLGPLDNSGGGGGPAATLILRGHMIDAQGPLGTIGVFSALQPGDNVTGMSFDLNGGTFVGPPSAYDFGLGTDEGSVTLLDPLVLGGTALNVRSGGSITTLDLTNPVGDVLVEAGMAGNGSTNSVGVVTGTTDADIIGGGGDDTFVVLAPGGPVDFDGKGGTDDLTLQGTAADETLTVGATTADAGGATITLANLETIGVNGGGGDDEIVADFSGGNPAGTTLNVDGEGHTTGDSMTLTGASPALVTHTFADETSGDVDVDGYAIVYTGLEPIADNLSATDRIFLFSSADETITLSDDGTASDGISLIDSDVAGESVAFVNPTGTLTVDTGEGTNVFTHTGLDTVGPPTALAFIGGTGTEAFNLKPSTSYAISVEGDAPATCPGDVLNLDLTGVTGETITASAPDDGIWSFTAAMPVSYLNIETLTNLPQLSFSIGGSPFIGLCQSSAPSADQDVTVLRDGADIVITADDGSGNIIEVYRAPFAAHPAIVINGGPGNDTFTVDRSAADVVPAGGLTVNGDDGDDMLTVLLGGPGDGGALTFNGEGGDDHMDVDLGAGSPTVVGAMTFNGGLQTTGDDMELTGGSVATLTHTFVNENDGAVDWPTATITYTGLEPVVDNVAAVARIFTFLGAAETITVSDDPGTLPGLSYIDSSLGESVTFVNPTGSLAVHGGLGADVINFTALDPLFAVPVTLTSGVGNDVFNVTPSAAHTIHVDGGAQTTVPGDHLDLVLTGVTTPTFTPGAPGAGTWTFGNRMTVTMVDIETNVDFLPKVTLTVDVPTIAEEAGTAVFTATLDGLGPVGVTVTLDFGGSATEGVDYSVSSPTIVIPMGSLTGTVTLTTIDDTVEEADETVIASVASVVGGSEDGVQTATTKILNIDTSVLLSITKQANSPQGNATGDAVIFTVVVTNYGSADATDVTVEDVLGIGLACACAPVVSVGTATHSGEPMGGTITWSGFPLVSGASATMTYEVVIVAIAPASLVNTATITASTPADPVTTDNSASAVIQVPQEANFPAGVQVNDIAFTEDALANPIILAGTINFGVYRGVVGQFPGEYNWLPASNGFDQPQYVTDILKLQSGDLLLATWGRAGLYRGTPDGRMWTPVSVRIPAITIVHALAQSPVDGTLYLSADAGIVFRSIDDGLTWLRMGILPGGSSETPTALVADPVDAGTVYAGTFGRGIKVSFNRGKTWSDAGGNATLLAGYAGHIFDLAFAPGTSVLFAATGRGTWSSSDGAATFSIVDAAHLVPGAGGVPPEVRAIAFDGAGVMYEATWGFGVFTNPTPTTGGTFVPFALRQSFIWTIAVNDANGEVFAATRDEGMQVLAAATSTANEQSGEFAEIPTEFVLEGNYPNPFNPSTTIRFAMPETGHVRLAVYDMLGRERSMLLDRTVQAGWHDVQFDASGLTTGSYIYVLSTPVGNVSKVLTLMK